MDMGIEDGLAEVVNGGYPPFAVVSVDGGDSWWHRRASGDDAAAMVLTELLPMLAASGLDTSQVGFIGWSMGGYGALLLGKMLGPARTAAICAVSPALYTSYDEAIKAGAFDGPADWIAYSVFGSSALSEIPLRVDCGASDRYYLDTKHFVASLRRPPSGVSFTGGHDMDAWRQKLPGQLAWLAS